MLQTCGMDTSDLQPLESEQNVPEQHSTKKNVDKSDKSWTALSKKLGPFLGDEGQVHRITQ